MWIGQMRDEFWLMRSGDRHRKRREASSRARCFQLKAITLWH